MWVFFAVFTQMIILTSGQSQPCMLCGGTVARLWSMHSREGDRYLRVDPTANVSHSGLKVDTAGELEHHFMTSLIKFKDVSTGFPDFETRIQLTFFYNDTVYHLQAVSEQDELRAINETEAGNLPNKSDQFAPERLTFEHSLFYVFESVKFRGYYLATKGNGETKLVKVHNVPYIDAEPLFKLIDPGQAVAAASFGNVVSAKRKRRMAVRKDSKMSFKQVEYLFPGQLYEKKRKRDNERKKSDTSSIKAVVRVPSLDIFTLCFWIKTKDDFAQVISINYRSSKKARVEISIHRGLLVLGLSGRRRIIRECGEISDGKWHHVCVSLQNTSRMFVYRDGEGVHQKGFIFKKSQSQSKRQGATVYLGHKKGSNSRLTLHGELTQVNIWDSYPLFRIRRIATNSACGGGNIVQWSDFLAGGAEDVLLFECEDCPQRRGYNFDKKTQNNLV